MVGMIGHLLVADEEKERTRNSILICNNPSAYTNSTQSSPRFRLLRTTSQKSHISIRCGDVSEIQS